MSWNYTDNPFNVWPTLNTAGWRFVMVSLVIIICFSLAGRPESGLELDRWFFKEAPFECIWRTSSAGLEWRRSPRFSSLSWLTLQKIKFLKVPLFGKEISFCNKIEFYNSNIFATHCPTPLISKTINSIRSKRLILTYQIITPSGYKVIKTFEFQKLISFQILNSLASVSKKLRKTFLILD